MSPWYSDLVLASQSDERLVTLALAGHERAFAAIVARYGRELLGVAGRFDREGRAEDIVQQTFLCALTALRRGTEVRHLRGWLHQILRSVAFRGPAAPELNIAIDEGDVVVRSSEQVAEARMQARAALSEIAQLPSRQQDALVQTAIQGRSRLEVADAMGLSEGAVRQLVHRARTTLRTAVAALTPVPLLRWAGTRGGSRRVELGDATAGVGAASAGGVALKMGTLLATGAVATGLIPSPAVHSSPAPHGVRSRVARAGRASAAPTAFSPLRYATPGYHLQVGTAAGGLSRSRGHLGTRTAGPASRLPVGRGALGQRAYGSGQRPAGGSPVLGQAQGGPPNGFSGPGRGEGAQLGDGSGSRGGPGPSSGGSDHSRGDVANVTGAQPATGGEGRGHDLGGPGSGSSGASGDGAASHAVASGGGLSSGSGGGGSSGSGGGGSSGGSGSTTGGGAGRKGP